MQLPLNIDIAFERLTGIFTIFWLVHKNFAVVSVVSSLMPFMDIGQYQIEHFKQFIVQVVSYHVLRYASRVMTSMAEILRGFMWY